MMTINKMQYTAPMVEVLVARVEKGFLLSEGQPANSNSNEQLEDSGNTYVVS
ncbi:MAG: hypothetical protein IKG88_07985 [Bacteroidales bacterium]|nr:hypothetical protein [Bacteroidales bacterium]